MHAIERIETHVRGGSIITSDWHDSVVEQLKAEGPNGSDAIARLIRTLLECRNPHLGTVLDIAARLQATPELLKAVETVKTAERLVPRPPRMPFLSEIQGGGSIGWTDGTESAIKEAARDALAKLGRS